MVWELVSEVHAFIGSVGVDRVLSLSVVDMGLGVQCGKGFKCRGLWVWVLWGLKVTGIQAKYISQTGNLLASSRWSKVPLLSSDFAFCS